MEPLNVAVEPLRAVVLQIGSYLPRIGVAAVVVVVGWLLAKALRFATVRALRALNVHVLTARSGLDAFLQQGGSDKDTSDLFGWIVFWLVVTGALIVAANGLALEQVAALLGRVFVFLPRLMVALAVLVFGLYFARFVGQSVRAWCRGAGVGDGELLGRVAQYAVVVFVLLIVIDQVDIGRGLLQRTFLILLGGVVLGLALAFGLGGRDRAAALIERWFPRRE